MTEHFQSGIHPDADQISTFLEGRASEPERTWMLEHLGGCATCRDVVFVAHQADASDTVPAVKLLPAPRRWWMPLGFAGAVVVCALLALIFYARRPPTPRQPQIAQTEPPAVVAPAQPVPTSTPAQAIPSQPVPAPMKLRQTTAASTALPAPSTAEGSGGGVGISSSAGVAGGIYAAQVAPLAGTARNTAELASAPIQEKARRRGAATMEMAPPPASPAAPSPASQNTAAYSAAPPLQQNALSPVSGPLTNNQAQNALPSLRIEHNRGPADGFSALTGVVTDMSGAAVNKASIELASADGASVRKVASGPDGRFVVPNVPPGRYELRVSAPGFNQTSEQLDLKPRDLAILNSVLQVGAATETVTVESNAPEVQTAQAEITAAAAGSAARPAPAASQVAIGPRIVSLDPDGALYLSRDSGQTWKKVRRKWKGKVLRVEVTGAATAEAAAVAKAGPQGAQAFRLTTDAGQVWTSLDGEHWQQK